MNPSDIVTAEFDGIDIDEFVQDIVKEIELANYRLLKVSHIDNLKERLGMKKGLKMEFRHYKIIEFCNLFTCGEMVMADFRAGVFVPQRYAVYRPLDGNSIYVSYLRPTSVARLFGSARMMKVAKEIEEVMDGILAALED